MLKLFITTIILFFTILSCSESGDNPIKTVKTDIGLFAQTLMHDNLSREYFVYVPTSYDGTFEIPLLLSFHGFGGTASNNLISSNMQPISDTEGFLLVSPQGASLKGEGKASHWNHELKSTKNKSDVDDFGFVEALIDEISSNYSIDSKRIYVCGYSNGAFFANSLSCYLNNKIAAVASIAGLMSTEIVKYHKLLHPTAAIMFHGTADQVVPYKGIEGYAMSIDQTLDYWIKFNNANTTPKINTFKHNNVEIKHYSYTDGRNGVVVEHYKIIGGNHWPQISYMGSNISRLIWDFVSKYDVDGLR